MKYADRHHAIQDVLMHWKNYRLVIAIFATAQSLILYGDEYMETSDGPVCKDCVEEMSVLDFMEMVREKFLKAEREM